MEGGGARPSWGVMTLQKRHATRHRRMSLRCRTYNARGTMLVLCPGGFFDEAYGGAASVMSPYPNIEIRAAGVEDDRGMLPRQQARQLRLQVLALFHDHKGAGCCKTELRRD
jgi:hypothetical protein